MFQNLAGFEIFTGMIAPAVLISATASLIFSTANRLGRIFDRVNLLKAEVEAVLEGRLSFPQERREYLKNQLAIQEKRAVLIQRSMAFLYLSTCLFITSSLTFALTIALVREIAWVATAIAMLGGIFMLSASALLLYESRYNLKFIKGQIDFTVYLEKQSHPKNSKS
ncbi:hypothetical protein CH373_02025 [Leptospira perolatii]|uniref:DUF2721 domain-containing protein n=1 Tax=Leptospira perolatii TaxID=2023191 RepID=A0A2M9ZRW5_9LEPT|nr:DUF2721 domain-containing protein [Leptospira perolatii]PJZ71304.1 hypothetical protein CH360_02025 [Leptospira perolatii]PJZ74838.1 hypothetical protein CH373_02025 [Leptospira perolatii]